MATVSIVTPMHNAARYIAETINSVQVQTYNDWEMILVDDKSSDSTVQIVEAFCKCDTRIKLVRLCENRGAANARNVAIGNASGRYIAFLDSDDLWHPNKLELQLQFMQANGYKFTYTAYDRFNDQGQSLGAVGVPFKLQYDDLLKVCYIGCLTVMVDKNYFGTVVMPQISKRQDFATWLLLLKKVKFAYGMNACLASYRIRDDSISANKFKAATYQWKVYRELEGLSLVRSIYCFAHYAIRGFFRQRYPRVAKFLGFLHMPNEVC